jgi:exonuclease VII small subunit
MKIDYLNGLRDLPDYCARFKREAIGFWFTLSGKPTDYPSERYFCYTPKYHAYYDRLASTIEISELIGIEALDSKRKMLQQITYKLIDPQTVSAKETFEELLTRIMNTFNEVKPEIERLVSELSKNETERLNEALHCYSEGCYFSTVAMAVTAIEYRLLQWMKTTNPSDTRLDELTLGQLVHKCLTEEQYKSTLPEKYHPLLRLCNEYRVFSVHAKSEPVNKRVAGSILTLSMEFLFDSSLLGKASPT